MEAIQYQILEGKFYSVKELPTHSKLLSFMFEKNYPVTAIEIERGTQIHRANCYDLLNRLIAFGIVKQVIIKTKMIHASSRKEIEVEKTKFQLTLRGKEMLVSKKK